MTNELSRDELLELYRQMTLIRRFEEKSAELYSEGEIGGFLHLYIGEEAVAVGACKALGKTDHLLTAYRDHGWAIARGLDPKRVMVELLGKATGVSGGRGGSMHMASAERHYWGGHAIVGGHLPLATGVGLAIRYKGESQAVLCVIGEGSTNIGYFLVGSDPTGPVENSGETDWRNVEPGQSLPGLSCLWRYPNSWACCASSLCGILVC